MPTRFYLPNTGTAPITPAFAADWELSAVATRVPISTSKSNTTVAAVIYEMTSLTDKDSLIRQGISQPLAAQTIAAQTLSFVVKVIETTVSNDQFTAIGVRVVSNDGSVVRGTVLAVTRDDLEQSAASYTSRLLTATTTEVIVEANDRLVIEIGSGGLPGVVTDAGALRIGDDSADDLPALDSGGALNDNPWVEFANVITFAALGAFSAPSTQKLKKTPISAANIMDFNL